MQGIAGLPKLDYEDRIAPWLLRARASGFLFWGNAHYGSFDIPYWML